MPVIGFPMRESAMRTWAASTLVLSPQTRQASCRIKSKCVLSWRLPDFFRRTGICVLASPDFNEHFSRVRSRPVPLALHDCFRLVRLGRDGFGVGLGCGLASVNRPLGLQKQTRHDFLALVLGIRDLLVRQGEWVGVYRQVLKRGLDVFVGYDHRSPR